MKTVSYERMSITNLLKKVSREGIPLVKEVLKTKTPQSYGVLCQLDVMIQHNLHKYVPKDVYVWPSTSECSFVAVSPLVTSKDITSACLYWDCNQLSSNETAGLLTGLPGCNGSSPLVLGNVDSGLFDMLFEDIKKLNIFSSGPFLHEDFHMFRVHREMVSSYGKRLPDGYECSPMTAEEIETMFKDWSYGWMEDIPTLLKCIPHLGSTAIRVKQSKHDSPQEPVCSMCILPTGLIGVARTHPEHRQKGLALVAGEIILDNISGKQESVYCIIKTDNTPSLTLCRRIGFPELSTVAWHLFSTHDKPYDRSDHRLYK